MSLDLFHLCKHVNLGGKPSAKSLLLAIAVADDGEGCFVSLGTLTRDLELSKSTALRALKNIEGLGLIEVNRKFGAKATMKIDEQTVIQMIAQQEIQSNRCHGDTGLVKNQTLKVANRCHGNTGFVSSDVTENEQTGVMVTPHIKKYLYKNAEHDQMSNAQTNTTLSPTAQVVALFPETNLEKPAVEQKQKKPKRLKDDRDANADPSVIKAWTLQQYLLNRRHHGLNALPQDCAALAEADALEIPAEIVQVAWDAFKRKRLATAVSQPAKAMFLQRSTNWPETFRKFLITDLADRIYFQNENSGQWQLNQRGVAARNTMLKLPLVLA